jgi:hypothetical protein
MCQNRHSSVLVVLPKNPKNCWICGESVPPDDSGIDELGFPVHAKCSHSWIEEKLLLRRLPKPSPKFRARLYAFFIKSLVKSPVAIGRVDLVPHRRLEDKIRHLCALSATATDENAWIILSELRLLIRQHTERLRMVAAGKLSGEREFTERRIDRRPA